MRKWEDWEIQYLEKKYQSTPVYKIAKKLDRTENSVKHKASSLGLVSNVDLNAKTLSKCFGTNNRTIYRWINNYGLPCKIIQCKKMTRYSINIDKFWKWAETNKDIINWSKYEQHSLPPEPKWLRETIWNYKYVNKNKKFTQNEILRIKSLLRKGMMYKDISEEIGRTHCSVKSVCRNIYANG